MDELKKRFEQLNDRERKLVLLSAIMVVVLVFYWGVLAPLNASISKNKRNIKQQTELLQWVKSNAQRAALLRASSSGTKTFNGSLTQLVNGTAKSVDVEVSRMQPQGDELQVWVDNAGFTSVVNWLNTLENSGVRIIDVDIVETNQPGFVKIRRLLLGKS